MGPNPLLPSEVREIAWQLCFPLNAWTCELIYRLDDAVLGARQADGASAEKGDADRIDIPANDVASLKVMVKARAARARLIAEHKAQAAADRARRLQHKPKP